MNIRERLKEAYENVSFNADRSWTNTPNAYHKTHMDLYLTERHIQRKIMLKNRPRTVRECIPSSKLAQYSNYCYDESREMSYSSCNMNSKLSVGDGVCTEPWELAEVEDLYKCFLQGKSEGDFYSKLDTTYESPLLNVFGFPDKILKIQISEERIKNIWNRPDHDARHMKSSDQIQMKLFASPIGNVFLFNTENNCNHEWFRNISTTRDLEQLEQLTQSFKEQNGSIVKLLGSTESTPSTVETYSSEILYSEVLQGLSPNRKCSKTDQVKVLTDESSVGQENFTNYTVLSSHRIGQDDSNQSSCGFVKGSNVPLQNKNKFLTPKTSLPNVYFQTDTHWSGYKYPGNQFLEHPPASVINHPLSSYVQQYFYSPVQTVPRLFPPNFNKFYPQVFAPSCTVSSPLASNVPRVYGPGDTKTNVELLSRRYVEGNRAESGQYKTETLGEIETISDEYQVSASVSEELELLALEQYSSNENFYQELERQATEQYTSSPE